jgi:diguanylate cyclase (GGDEF)-like protein/PAS domain S-box-containing protein
LILAIVSLHFTAMGALIVTPFAVADGALTDDSVRHVLAIAVAGVGLLVLGTGAASHLIDNQTRDLGQARLRNLVEGAVDGMVVERDGRIVTVNQAFEALVCRNRDRIVGQPVAAFFGEADELREGDLVRASLRHADGGTVPVEVATRVEERRGRDAGVKVYAVRDLRSRLEQERRIAHLARHDSLTGLPNRASYLERLEETIANAGTGETVALLAIDLDRFKEVNDLHGHAAGDHVLKVIADRVRGVLREGEFFARLGGDEFVALTKVIDHAGAHELAHRLEEQLAAPIPLEHVTVACGGSIGIAVYPDDADSATQLMNNADLAMYRAKASVGSRICFYETSMDDAVRARRRMATELRDALSKDQFELHYQVQTSVRTGEATGYEVLLRWRHPERGFVPPSEFIPLAEESGLILVIGQWVLRRACEAAAGWDEPHKIAVNLSAVQLGQGDLPRMVHQTLLDTGLSPTRLELEITETAMILDPARTTHILRQIKALGVSIAMDDFGVGYSSLSTLRAFPFDKIKLDRSFMTELDRSPQARAIIRAVLALGDSLEIAVIAEGVETAEQLAFLREQGCGQAQGYLLGRPQPAIGSPLVCAVPPNPDQPVFEHKKAAG